MAGIAFLRRLLMKKAMQESAPFQNEGIMSISKSLSGNIDTKVKRWVESAKRQGQDIDKMSEQEIKYIIELNKPKGPTIGGHRVIDAASSEGQGITRDLFNMLDRRSGKNVIKTDFGKPFAEEVVTVERVITDIKKMKPMDSMKEANKVLKGDGRYKSLSKADRKKIVDDESVTDHIFERNIEPDPEDFAQGGRTGLSYLLAEDTNQRVPFSSGLNAARRKFLQMLGAGAAGIGAAKTGLFGLLKGGGKKTVIRDLTQIPIKSGVDGMPAWFKPLVNKVIKEGTEVPSGAERVIVHKTKLPNSKTDVYVNQDLSTGDVWVDIGVAKHGFPDGHLGQPVRLEYKAKEIIEPDISKTGKVKSKGGETKEEFNVEEAEFTGGHPENVKFEESTIQKFGNHGSNFDEVEMFATGKVKNVKTKSKPRPMHQKDIDFASGGLARMLGE